MKYTNRFKLAAVILLKLFVAVQFGFAAQRQEEIGKIISAIQSYDHGQSRQNLTAVEKLINETYGNKKLRAIIEKELVKVLESDASFTVRQFVCQKLWMIGTDASVPILSNMLPDADTHLVEAACYALSQHPSPAVNAALRETLVKTKSTGRIAVINLLGDRKDAKSAKQIAEFISNTDDATANAAIVALGKIAGDVSLKELTRYYENNDFKYRMTVALALLQCGHELVKTGKISEAKAVYKQLMTPSNSLHVRRGALENRIDIGDSDAVALIFSTIRGTEADLKPAAIAKIRTLHGGGLSQRFMDELPELPDYEQVLLIGALADRGDPVIRPSLKSAARHSELQVRIAALNALGSIGDVSSIEVLINAFSSQNPDEVKAAETSLRIIKGEGVDENIVSRFKTASGNLRATLINILSDRKYVPAVHLLLDEAESADSEVSRAALRAMRNMAGPETLPHLVQILVRLKDENLRTDAERAVQQVARQISDANRQTETIVNALHSAEVIPVRCSLLRVLGEIANEPAYQELEKASKDSNTEIRNTAARALSEWPNVRAIERLRAIIEETDNHDHRIIALRGYIRLVGQLNVPPGELVKNYIRALSYTERPDVKILVFSGLAKVHHPDALKVAVENLEKKDVQREAALAALSIARAIAKANAEITDAAMKRICESVPDTSLCAQARLLISKQK